METTTNKAHETCFQAIIFYLRLHLDQWLSTFSLKGVEFRPRILLEVAIKHLTEINWQVMCYCRTKTVTQNISEVLLKDCWGRHKGCLRNACGFPNRGWESLT